MAELESNCRKTGSKAYVSITSQHIIISFSSLLVSVVGYFRILALSRTEQTRSEHWPSLYAIRNVHAFCVFIASIAEKESDKMTGNLFEAVAISLLLVCFQEDHHNRIFILYYDFHRNLPSFPLLPFLYAHLPLMWIKWQKYDNGRKIGVGRKQKERKEECPFHLYFLVLKKWTFYSLLLLFVSVGRWWCGGK